jgi:branched-chain amino acid transport system ATP-binding protein
MTAAAAQEQTHADDSTAPVLQCTRLSAGYGSVRVVRDFDLSLAEGQVLAVRGPYGAGKSTLMSTLAGLIPRLGGEVHVSGEALPSGRAAAANKAGVVLVPDDRALFTALTVRENLTVARKAGGPGVDEMMDLFPALTKRLKVSAGALSGGEQQMLAVARGLVQRPKVLLIDEMSMGLAPVIVADLLPIVRRIADETRAVVVIVEQHVKLALAVADQAMVIVHGDIQLSGLASELAASPDRLEAAYLGEH